jgi:4-hydroxy-3-methylbut-2-enyl diphosphate reductase
MIWLQQELLLKVKVKAYVGFHKILNYFLIMNVTIDKNSGFCFGVEFAIQMAEDEMENSETLYCLGDIVHNDVEVRRLNQKGLRVITRNELTNIRDCKVLIRAHGEPPETYRIALENNLEIIDASCPVVLKLQNRIKDAYELTIRENGQIVIYGKEGHAEVIGLNGQTKNNAIIVSEERDLDKIDFSKNIILFSQTTKSTDGFYKITKLIEERINNNGNGHKSKLIFHDSICRQVSNRAPHLVDFCKNHDVVLFVSSKKSSNGRALYEKCWQTNKKSYFIENESEIERSWFDGNDSIGICGATSTPMWLMEIIKKKIQSIDQ